MYYKDDRYFTDQVHDIIAVPIIYSALGWHDIKNATKKEDMNMAIDYFAKDSHDCLVAVQERFRRVTKAYSFSDFTLRYQRPNEQQYLSEFFKMYQTAATFNGYYMVYGVVTVSMTLLRYAVINLNSFYRAIEDGFIKVGERNSVFSSLDNGILFSGLGFNRDNSSSFVSFDIRMLEQAVPNCVLTSFGY